MTGRFLLDWPVLTVSLFNTILLTWLGLTVLLNTERRTWGVWMAGGGLLLGGAFFVSHSAILGYGLGSLSPSMNFWWSLGWGPVLVLPFAWYMVMLWYAGFWDDARAPLHRRHRLWLGLTVGLVGGLVGLFLFANPLPSYVEVESLTLRPTLALGGVPLLALTYPVYIVLCLSLALDALRRPAPSGRVMGDLARRRARPWLAATTGMLLVMSLLVAWALLWIVFSARARALYDAYDAMLLTVVQFDLVIESLVAGSTVLLGQAIVAYEIFTGKTLPRRGFLRQWRSAVVVGAAYSAAVAWTLTRHWQPVAGVLAATLLMTVFYALFHWRSYAERERYIDHLRPFVASQRLYETLLTQVPAQGGGPGSALAYNTGPGTAPDPFAALCGQVLGVRVAYLAALGPFSPLVGPPLVYPAGAPPLPPPVELAPRFDSPQTMCVPLDPARYGGALWAVPLWSERGLIGVLLLGAKRDGGLYTQEEIEIARASGERLIDTRASAAMAARLMSLQRQRLAESQVIDRRTRRVLHDDVLPRLHAAMLSLSRPARTPAPVGGGLDVAHGGRAAAPPSDALALLADVHRQIADLLHEMPTTAAPEVTRRGLIGALRQALDDELGGAFDGVTWEVAPAAAPAVAALSPLSAEVLFYAAREAIRNAARYGRDPADPARLLHLRVAFTIRTTAPAPSLEVRIEDDGVGLDAAPPAPDTAPTGSGQGLALHSTLLAVVGGALAVESLPHRYTRVVLTLPL